MRSLGDPLRLKGCVRDKRPGAREDRLGINAARRKSRLEKQLSRHDGRQALGGFDPCRHGQVGGGRAYAGTCVHVRLAISPDACRQAREANCSNKQNSDQSHDAPPSEKVSNGSRRHPAMVLGWACIAIVALLEPRSGTCGKLWTISHNPSKSYTSRWHRCAARRSSRVRAAKSAPEDPRRKIRCR